MQTIQSYKKNYVLKDHYDAIIIGSGMGSLATGAILAKEGQRVLILERHYTAGGFTHVFKRRGYEWDVGIHYIGEMQREKSILKKLFDYVTDGELKWADMGEVYDRVVIGDKKYNFVKGVSNFKNHLAEQFPDETEAIKKYVDLVFLANKASRNFYMEKAMPPLVSKVSGNFMRKPFLKYSNKTTDEVLRSLTSNEELIKVLSAQYGDYGLPPKQSSFSMHASVARHYFSGGNFPVGGCVKIVETIEPVLAKTQSTILINAEVDEVLIENNTAKGVKMKDGKIFKAKNIISGAGINVTYKKLIPEASVKKHKLDAQLQKVKPSVAHACLYIGLNGAPRELNLPKANYWVYPEKGSHDEIVENYLADNNQPFPVVYISFPAAKDPTWSDRYPGKSTIDIITLLPYEAVAQWEDTKWKKRGEEYDAYKEKLSQRLLAHLYRLEPQLKGRVDYYELSTPITTKHFVNYETGEIYGIEHTPERFRQKFLRPHTPIKNFYLTGQDIVTAGIGAALFSGLITASAMTKKNLMDKVIKE
jgi:all-trans-retinol 13,14-reductase